MTRIALIVRVGRANYTKVLEDLVRSIQQHGHFHRHDLALYLSIDGDFQEKSLGCVQSDKTDTFPFLSIRRIECSDRDKLIEAAVQSGAASSLEAALLFRRRPYAFQLNAAIAFAILDGNEVAIFFDDDQGFAVPVSQPDETLEWHYMDVIGDHLRELMCAATVTTGPIAGCVSPIPGGLVELIGKTAVRDLGNLYFGGHEFLSEREFEDAGYRSMSDPVGCSCSRSDSEGTAVKWVSPSNMGINIQREYPPFFNPPGARGEDAFFFLGLKENEIVSRINAGVFHDPFLRYPGIYHNDFPSRFVPAEISAHEIARFAAACVGWLRYMPLYMKATQFDWAMSARHIEQKQSLAIELGRFLASTLNDNAFLLMPKALRYHLARTERDHDHWCIAATAWRERIHPWLTSRA